MQRCEQNLHSSGYGPVTGFYDYSDEPLGSPMGIPWQAEWIPHDPQPQLYMKSLNDTCPWVLEITI